MEENKKNPALEKAESITIKEVVEVETHPEKKVDYKKSRVKKQGIKIPKNGAYDGVEYYAKSAKNNNVIKKEKARKVQKNDNVVKKERKNDNVAKNERFLRAGVGVLAIFSAVLGSLLTYKTVMVENSTAEVDSIYKKSFYSTVDYIDELDLNIDKFLVTEDGIAAQTYLSEIATLSELAEDNFQQLPLPDENKFYTAKLINQVGDYSKYLNKKIVDGTPVSDEDVKAVRQLSKGVKELKKALAQMSEDMQGDFRFENMKERKFVLSGFEDLQNASMEYPALIYDGPFSDGRNDLPVKGLSGDEVGVDTARLSLEKTFKNLGVKNLESAGEVNGRVTAYCFTGEVENGALYAQVSKVGGKVLMFTVSSNATKDAQMRSDKSKDSEDISAGENFLAQIGIDNMKAVWTAKSDGVSVINFAYQSDGVIVYADLIKLKVQNATVIGMEGFDYYLNHTKRDISAPMLSEEQALAKVSKNLSVKNGRLALIPIGNREELSYEFMAEEGDSTYYIYISATNGRQLQLFKVVEGTEGTLLR